jgi:hypothetical protein
VKTLDVRLHGTIECRATDGAPSVGVVLSLCDDARALTNYVVVAPVEELRRLVREGGAPKDGTASQVVIDALAREGAKAIAESLPASLDRVCGHAIPAVTANVLAWMRMSGGGAHLRPGDTVMAFEH